MRRRILCVSLYCSHKKQIIPTKPEVFIIAPTQKQLDNLKKGEAYRFTKENASEMGRRGQAASVKAHKRNKDVYMIGIAAGLIFGIMADNFAFNFDGKLDKEEFFNALKAILPAILGGIAGVMIGGPGGAAIGLAIGTLISLNVMDFDYSGIIHKFQEFFLDLTGFYDKEWNSWSDMVHGLWEGLKSWWHGLSLGRFDFKLPHLTVTWQELGANSILARYLGITAIPHMGVEWYARGGIVDGATLIGAGEQGKEAIIPLERHTEWIRLVAVQLKEELAKLSSAPPPMIRMIPAGASALVPYAATAAPTASYEPPDLSGLATTIAQTIAEIAERPQPEQQIRVYLDGRQLSDAVTRYQRRENRSNGV